jgi:uncharacterized protein (DUF885 family)
MPSGEAQWTRTRWDALVERTIERAFVRDPGFAVSQGRHEFDGQIADLSKAALSAEAEEAARLREQVRRWPSAGLDPIRRLEREHLLAHLDATLFWLVRVREYERNPMFYAGAVDPGVYVTRAYAPLEQRLRAYIAHAQAMPRALEAMRTNLKPPLPRTFVETAVDVYAGLARYLREDVVRVFGEVDDPRLQAELSRANEQALLALDVTLAFLAAQKASATDDFALGEERFREMLWATERVDTPLEVLEAVGKRDLEQNLAELTEACRVLAPGRDLSACAALVNADKPEEGPVLAARRQLAALKRFVQDHDLVSIPSDEEALVEEAPPHKRWNQAFIEIPGPFERDMPSIYYIAPPDPAWSAEERAAYVPGEFDLLFISAHEVWPGHFLQFLHAKRAPRLFGRLFVGYAFAEGWAHYAESLVWEAGLGDGDLRVRVGQLLNALLRNVRFLSAIGLHTKGMRVAEAEQMFRDKALQDPGNAKQQAARGTFDPAYLNYTLGKLMIRKLREDWTRTRGGRRAYRAFHDTLLSFGGPPLPLVREAMLGARGDLL